MAASLRHVRLATVAATALLTAVMTVAAWPAVQAPITALRFQRLIDGRGAVMRDAVVIIAGERIQSVASGGAVPRGASVIDLRRYTAVPGLIDAHTHMTYYWDPS